jgi:DNA (cytosine-5)-methyltransferase 1
MGIRELTFGSVCSGIEAASVAWHRLGWKAAWFSEIEPFPSAVLAYHYPDTPNLGDMTTLPERIRNGEIVAPDLLCGGTPCQAFSVAGMRRSLDDARGNLSLTFCEVSNAIDAVRRERGDQPAIIFWENVPGVLNTKDNAFGCFLAGLAGEDAPLVAPRGRWTNAGVVLGPQRAIAWRVLDAQYFGVAQRRRRVFVVASARNGFSPAAVLFERESLRRDTPPSREAGEAVAPTIRAGAPNGSPSHGARSGDSRDELIVPQPYSVANCLTARMHKGINSTLDEGQTPVIGFNARQDPDSWADRTGPLDTDSSTQAVAFSAKDYGADATADLSPTLRAMGHAESHANGGGQMAVAQSMQVRRLTPVECERLQGFPDGYTLITYRGKSAADGPRYKALGNSWAVPVVRWIGERMQRAVFQEKV